MSNPPWSLKSRALQKVAALSVAQAGANGSPKQLERLIGHRIHLQDEDNLDTQRIPLCETANEKLVALCKAAPLPKNADTPSPVLAQLCTRLQTAPLSALSPSPRLWSILPFPHESLTYELVHALLAIGLRQPKYHTDIVKAISNYLARVRQASDNLMSRRREVQDGSDIDLRNKIEIVHIALSLLGFLDASARLSDFYKATERLEILNQLQRILTNDFKVTVEGTFSSMRTAGPSHRILAPWRTYVSKYATIGRPLGGMLLQSHFMRFLVSSSSLQLCRADQLRKSDVLDLLLANEVDPSTEEGPAATTALIEIQSDLAAESMRLLDDGSDYLQLGSAWQQRLAFATRASSLQVFLNCMIMDEDMADAEVLMSWLESSLADPLQMADDALATSVLKSMATIAVFSPSFASNLSRSLPRFIVQSGITGDIVVVAAHCLARILRGLSQDAVITALYSLGNVLSVGGNPVPTEMANGSLKVRHTGLHSQHATGSAISLNLSGEEETAAAHGNVVRAIVAIAGSSEDEKTIALAQTMLLQKLGKVSGAVDLCIIKETASLALRGGSAEFSGLLKLYARLGQDAITRTNTALLASLSEAQFLIAKDLQNKSQSPLYSIFLVHLLETIVSKGDIQEGHSKNHTETDNAARGIIELIPVVAELLSNSGTDTPLSESDYVSRLQREVWFNIIVHGVVPGSPYGDRMSQDFQKLAKATKALIAQDRLEHLESDIELNTVLRRGMTGPNTAEQKKRLISFLPQCENDVRGLTYPKVVFLNAAYLLEMSRATGGDCSQILTYFLDPSLSTGPVAACMNAVADSVLNVYLRKSLSVVSPKGLAPSVARQLATMFSGCCHRIPRVQQAASVCAEKIINLVPSSLCQKSSLFALLELLSLMWTSCLEAEVDEYGLRANYTSSLGNVSIEVSDNYILRRSTLDNLLKRARGWVGMVIGLAPLDVKGLLQTYLAEYDDESTYGHISLGRSFAVEMGTLIPSTDQKLGAIERHGDFSPNTASDFVAQYTTRQEYKYADVLPGYDKEWAQFLHVAVDEPHALFNKLPAYDEDEALLAHLRKRAADKKFVSIGELRDLLRRAAALLCRTGRERCAIIQYLVELPFALFTKQSIKLGVSLWLGLINENPSMEPRVLTLVAEEWEKSVRNKVGAFSPRLRHSDPFYLKEEFAPSDKDALLKRQQAAHNLIAPHLRVLQFLSSHFNAGRLGSPHSQRIFHRLIIVTLSGLRTSAGHPLAREIHFHFILFSLNIFRHCNGLDQTAKWRLKDAILSAGLVWFQHAPRWSFGSNRLQIKAEMKLMADVESALASFKSAFANATGSMTSLASKQLLLSTLLESEQIRLHVWLYPLDHEKRRFLSHGSGKMPAADTLTEISRIAWIESPSLAIELTKRFASEKLANDIRGFILRQTELAVGEPEALQLMLGASLPPDVSFQLKYLLYWAHVNPVTAVTYFLPEFNNHPYIVQYAMRALESHSVDITFFYVPQIVQTLRYDVLGYVQRYILATAQLSQLFAHQIIWNMTANAYKDDEATIEDSLKPTLDAVKGHMISSFSGPDQVFYEREFSFFNEITDISGKLRPFIKKSKPEKKQKIEDELRKINLEVGVYLPSNPDGIVVGIDRKSGKPLQSHAKAPYMATFRIKKARTDVSIAENSLEPDEETAVAQSEQAAVPDESYEVWQSAIFKVGDDCRQDVLALQMIAAFRGIFNDVGLDVYVYPYRVTATAPGCGVIDVLPNSISRDMLGREAVNGLYDYFISKYGSEKSIRFQEARNNFVKSMAAYSVISYLLQFKDRHNGNIMIDDAGHILHIDFGFCFDIAPGGVRFERAPFKLTSEMVAVMGGSTSAQPYKWFEELCVKAFLASRPYAEKLCHIVVLMLGSGLPCFKPETIAHLRQRFVLEKTEREAADFMKDLIRKSYGSYSTGVYDQFQLLTNGIPY